MISQRAVNQARRTEHDAYAPASRQLTLRSAKYATPLLGLLALFLCGFGPPTLKDRDVAPRHRLTIGQLSQIQQARTPLPGMSAQSVLVYDLDSGRTLMTRAIDLSISPASLAKLMTALLVLEADRLSEQVTIQPQDLIGEAAMGLRGGEVLIVEELLWGLLVASGNDAAMALARYHSGQVEAFVQRMNLRAEELNLHGTRFANPNGFDADGQVSNALDLLALVRNLWQYPLFRQIVGTPSTSVASHELQTTNRLLGSYPGINGVKTGTTFRSGQSLIAGVEQDGHQLFAVILGSEDRYYDTQAVLAAVQSTYGWVPLRLSERPTVLDRVFDSSGKRWFLHTEGGTQSPLLSGGAAPVDVMLAQWERQELHVFRRVHPPPFEGWSAGMEAGVLEWRQGNQVIATQRLVVR
jgi:D-alanyl-D-alanine carboxypeptidase (penicillin-binding protein 5/6)